MEIGAKTKYERLVDGAEACLMGVAIGDAMGMPVETLKRDAILAATGGKGITFFVDPIARRDWLVGMKAGATTDDWQLTRVVAESLIRTHGRFDVQDCANGHVEALKKSTFGWGGTTRIAIEDIRDGKRVVGRDPIPPMPPGKGCGNGIIMKVAPLAISETIYYETFDDELWKSIKELGSITHPDIRASIAAFAVAYLLRTTFLMDYQNALKIDESNLPTMLRWLTREVQKIEREEQVTTEMLSQKLQNIESATSDPRGCGFHANDTAAFAIGMFYKYPQDFERGVLEAVNAGGDTDTAASIVGALIGANVGVEGIPLAWRVYQPEFGKAIELANKLCRKDTATA
jgi:ADP-ribosylglycohydrolase